MIPRCRRGPLVVFAVMLLAPACAVAQEPEVDAPAEQGELPPHEQPVVEPAPQGGLIDRPPAEIAAPQADPIAPPTATPTPGVSTAPQQPGPTGPRERPAPAGPAPQPAAPGAPAQPASPGVQVLGRSFPSPVQPPAPPEPPGVHITVVPPSEPTVTKNRLRGNGGSPASDGAQAGSDQPAADATPGTTTD